MADLTLAPDARQQLVPGSVAETLLNIVAALGIIALSVASLILGTVFGVAVCAIMTLALCLARPGAAPVLVITAFLFQNMIIATFTPLVVSDTAFDTLRGTNFVILMTAYACFLAASLQTPPLRHARPWIIASLVLLAIVVFYLGLGAVTGDLRDAIVYFRNTITPIACFHIAHVAACRYRIDIVRTIGWLGGAAVLYGYLELVFQIGFLSTFNGDQYIQRQMARQIETGYWEGILKDTGFVLRSISDVMTTSVFNTPFFDNILPQVFRLSGPNFHPISFAYALTIMAVYMLFKGRWVLPALTLPLLFIIGSKGAMALLLIAVAARIGVPLVGRRLVTLLVAVVAALWIGSAIVLGIRSGDFHTLGFFAGLRDFLGNPLGVGLGHGGNLSTTTAGVNWSLAQETGATEFPMESAVGVMLYQMGVGGVAFLGFIAALAVTCRNIFVRTGDQVFLFGYVAVTLIGVNSVLQEEAIYSPLAIGFALLLTGLALGTRWRREG